MAHMIAIYEMTVEVVEKYIGRRGVHDSAY
jgi:hypothetical protein